MGDNKAMSGCSDEGRLRAYLDDALPADERIALGTHLGGCTACWSRLREVEALATQVGELLPRAVSQPEPGVALAQLRATLARERSVPVSHAPNASRRRVPDNITQRRGMMSFAPRFWSGPRRPLFAGLTALAMVLGLLAFPPVRALAGQLLQVFRVQDVMFVPIDTARLEQLESVDFDPKTLFMAEPELINDPAAPQTVASAAEAANAAGFTPAGITSFASTALSSDIVVHDRRVVQTQVNVESARQLLELMGVNDVQLPDALGAAPIVADIPPTVESSYTGSDYRLTLLQGPSPDVKLPEGVDLAVLGRAGLRLLGIPAQQAEAISRNIDWSSTLVVPFPSDVSTIQQVTVGGRQALLVGDGDSHSQLYWQSDDRFYMLEGDGLLEAEIVAAAESVR